jgi:mannose-6-phosphate isomerase-like protein (cupin superfamily)
MLSLIFALMLMAPQQPTPAATQKSTPPAATQKPASAPPAAQTPATQTPAAQTGTAARKPTSAGTATLQVRVTDRSGNPTADAEVQAEGPSNRSASTGADGSTTLRTMTPGTYRVRAEREGFITLEKEVTVRAGAPITTEFALSRAPVVEAAPPPPPPPAPAPTPAPTAPPPPPAPKLQPGDPTVLSISNLAEKSLSGRDPVKTVAIGCSGASRAQLVVVRETLPATAHPDTDDMIYLVAGEATVTLGSAKEQSMTPSWFALAPRGTSYTIARKGRNPAVLLMVVSGQPCGATETRAAGR